MDTSIIKSADIRKKIILLGDLNAIQERLNAGNPPLGGICCYVHQSEGVLRFLFESWLGFSGSAGFPVPSFDATHSRVDAYDRALKTGTLWDDSTKYGRARRALLTHCINTLQTELADLAYLRDLLKRLYEEGPMRYIDGICMNIAGFATDRRVNFILLDDLVPAWPLYSGNTMYPVPHTPEFENPEDAYELSCNKWTGAYGDLRRDLLVYCIDQLNTGLRGTRYDR